MIEGIHPYGVIERQAQKAREETIVLRTRPQQLLFLGGLLASVLFGFVLLLLAAG